MLEKIFSLELPVGESIKLLRNRLVPDNAENIEELKRISIVTGVHGDEMEGQYICYELTRRIESEKEFLNGVVDIFPAVNPIGLDNAIHTIPKERIDMNRIFPGNENGTMMEHMAKALTDSICGSEVCIDVHGSDIFSRESLQVRIYEDFKDIVLPYAKMMDSNLIWVNPNPTVADSTLTYSMNCLGVPSLTIECGIGNSINREEGDRVVNGIINVMRKIGIWEGPGFPINDAKVCSDEEIDFIRAEHAGLFIYEMYDKFAKVRQGQTIGKIIDVNTNKVVQKFIAPHTGILFTIREFPMVYEGALIARILVDN